MMDLIPIAQAILVYTVLAVGVLATVLTGFAQLRELPRAWSSEPNPAMLRRGFLAASVGMGSVGGSILALELGGPGAIGWMWIASLLGMGLIYAEVMVAVRFRGRVGGRARAGMVHALSEGLPNGRPLALLFGLVFMVFAIAAGSLLQTQQTGVLLETLGGDRFMIAGFLVVASAIGLLVPKLRLSVVALGPVAVALYVIAALLMIVRAPGSGTAVLSQIIAGIANPDSTGFAAGAAGGGVLMAMQIGFLRATLATEAGLGSAGFTPQADTSKDPGQAAAAAMLAPLISGIVVPTLTVLVTLTASPWIGQRIDEPGERLPVEDERTLSDAELSELAAALTDGNVEALSSDDRKRTMALWAPLERPQSRGTSASLQAGQTVVLPTDAAAPEGSTDESAGLLDNYVYPMVMRASPRGMKMAVDESNAILLGLSEETQVIREVVYRDRDAKRGLEPAYDRRIAVNNSIIELGDYQYVRLTPAESGVDFQRMSRVRDGPYVAFGDFHFDARVVKMFQNRWGPHHAMIEAYPDPRRPLSLRTTVSSSAFRGPYFDTGEARPPLSMVAREHFDAPIGARLLVEYRPPARGMEFGHLLASGELMTPPWNFLAETTQVVLRHKTDPTQDLRYPVTSKFIDGTLRFVSATPEISFAKAAIWKDYTGPYLLPPAYQFEVEVHSGVRFPASSTFLSRLGLERSSSAGPLSDRRTLVAVHPYGEPQGSRGDFYDPHPAEVAPFMDGPWVAGDGLARVGWAARVSGKRGSDLLLAISVLILALTTMIAWATYGARAADFVFGRGGGIGFALMFLVAGMAGSVLSIMQVIKLADYAMLVLVLLNGVGLTLLLLRARKSA